MEGFEVSGRVLLRIHLGLKFNPPTAHWSFMGEKKATIFIL